MGATSSGMLSKAIHILLAILNVADAIMLDSALRDFGIPSEGHSRPQIPAILVRTTTQF